MIRLGYMAKQVVRDPDWLGASQVKEICAVSNCISKKFCDYVTYWQHNGYWFFNSLMKIEYVCHKAGLNILDFTLFYYEGHDLQYDAQVKTWSSYRPESDFEAAVNPPQTARRLGFDVVTFSTQTQPECSPLSCNLLAEEVPVNEHCLLDSLEAAIQLLESGACDNTEPGPFRIIGVHQV